MDRLRCQVRTVARTRFCRVLTRPLALLGLVLTLSFLGPTGCSAPTDCNAQSSAPQIVYRLGEDTAEWLDSPFPSSHFQAADGFINWETLPNPYGVELVDFYRDIAQAEVAGAGLTSPAFIQFTQPLDLRSLPRGNTDATVSPESSVFLVDIDPSSPERGSLIPFRWTWNSDATPFLPSYTLSVAPSWGRPLRPDTLYAWVFTRALRASTGESIERAPWSRALLADTPEDICTNTAPILEKETSIPNAKRFESGSRRVDGRATRLRVTLPSEPSRSFETYRMPNNGSKRPMNHPSFQIAMASLRRHLLRSETSSGASVNPSPTAP